MMNKKKKQTLDKFGKFMVENLRDKGIAYSEGLLNNEWKSPSTRKIQKQLGALTVKQKALVQETVTMAIDVAMHDFLFAVQEAADMDNDIQIMVDGKNIAVLSDGLHGEAYSEEGWYAKYSNYSKD